MKTLKSIPLEEFIAALLDVYEKGYSFADINVQNEREDGSYQLAIVGVGEIAEMLDENDDLPTPETLYKFKNLN